MKKKQLKILLFSIVVTGIMLAGCSSKTDYGFDTDESLIYVQGKDSIISIFVEDYNKKTYGEKKELKKAVEAEVEDYNKTASEDKGIELVNLDLTKSVATLELKYKSVEDYNAYNTNYIYYGTQITMQVGTIEELSAQGISFEGEFNKVGKDDKISVVSLGDVKDKDELKVIALNEGNKLRVKGTIMYTSTNVTVKDGLAATVSGENNYIIYK